MVAASASVRAEGVSPAKKADVVSALAKADVRPVAVQSEATAKVDAESAVLAEARPTTAQLLAVHSLADLACLTGCTSVTARVEKAKVAVLVAIWVAVTAAVESQRTATRFNQLRSKVTANLTTEPLKKRKANQL